MIFERIGAWFLSLLVVFGLGVNTGRDLETEDVNPELKQKVTEHLDVIVDEMAGLADDLSEEVDRRVNEFRESDAVQSVEEFIEDVREIVDNTSQDIEEHFAPEEKPAEENGTEATPAEETVPAEDPAPAGTDGGEEQSEPESEATPG